MRRTATAFAEAAYDPAIGPNGTLYLMIDSGTGAPGAALSFGSASSGGAVAFNGPIWEVWAMDALQLLRPAERA